MSYIKAFFNLFLTRRASFIVNTVIPELLSQFTQPSYCSKTVSLNLKTIERHICLDVALVRLKDFTLKARALITAKTRDTSNICHDLYGKICKIFLSVYLKEKLSNRERTVCLTPMKTYTD